jgi:hypothetical protein
MMNEGETLLNQMNFFTNARELERTFSDNLTAICEPIV